MCDTELGGKVGDTPVDNMTQHCGLTVVEELIFPSPTIYACISLHFHIWELMLFRVEGVAGRACLEQKVARLQNGIWSCLVSVWTSSSKERGL